ncbi:MAG: hypothetical protein FJY35_10030 [Betaproteobacteria bacterium]|nr:hypothetical protein [Betaproteobacteria bacterium]
MPNRLVLQASLAVKKPLRYSPTGAAVLECTVWHASEVDQGASRRRLSFFTAVKAVGPVAEQLSMQPIGQALVLVGFVAPRAAARSREEAAARPVSGLIFNVTEFETGD